MSKWLPSLTRLRQILLLSLLFVSGCATLTDKQNWPEDLPPRVNFVEAWQKQSQAGTNNASLNEHLTWILRFYQGSVLYPVGWNDMKMKVVASIPDQAQAKQAADKLDQLGLDISIEWAQNNADRKIDSGAIAVWGNALRTSIEENEQLGFIKIIEKDVDSLLNGNLVVDQIKRERYYPEEDYDNF